MARNWRDIRADAAVVRRAAWICSGRPWHARRCADAVLAHRLAEIRKALATHVSRRRGTDGVSQARVSKLESGDCPTPNSAPCRPTLLPWAAPAHRR